MVKQASVCHGNYDQFFSSYCMHFACFFSFRPLNYPAGENGCLPSQQMKRAHHALPSAWTLIPGSSPGQFLVIVLVTSSRKSSFSPHIRFYLMFPQNPLLLPPSTCCNVNTVFLCKYLFSLSLPATVQDTGQRLATAASPRAVPGLWRPHGYHLITVWKTKPG